MTIPEGRFEINRKLGKKIDELSKQQNPIGRKMKTAQIGGSHPTWTLFFERTIRRAGRRPRQLYRRCQRQVFGFNHARVGAERQWVWEAGQAGGLPNHAEGEIFAAGFSGQTSWN